MDHGIPIVLESPRLSTSIRVGGKLLRMKEGVPDFDLAVGGVRLIFSFRDNKALFCCRLPSNSKRSRLGEESDPHSPQRRGTGA